MKKKENVILLFIFVILIVLLFIVVNKSSVDSSSSNDKEEIKLVIDYNKFYTIESCANRFYSSLGSGNVSNINSLLDVSYGKEFINQYIDRNVYIKVNEMYYLDNNYYLKGYVYEELVNGIDKLNEEYLLIKLASSEKLFSVVPLLKVEYEEVVNG